MSQIIIFFSTWLNALATVVFISYLGFMGFGNVWAS